MKGKIFNTQEVQAIIAGNKTMFREVVKPQPNSNINPVYLKAIDSWQWSTKESRRKPKFEVDQEIFVKESFVDNSDKNYCCESGLVKFPPSYKADSKYYYDEPQWKLAQHMKQEHSRLTLRIKSVKVERLQDINNNDAIAEAPQYSVIQPFGNKNPIDFFRTLWQWTHKKQEHKWEANPWVFVYGFEVVR